MLYQKYLWLIKLVNLNNETIVINKSTKNRNSLPYLVLFVDDISSVKTVVTALQYNRNQVMSLSKEKIPFEWTPCTLETTFPYIGPSVGEV